MTSTAHSGNLNPANPARGHNRTKPPVAPHGVGQATGATQHAFNLAFSGGKSTGSTKKRRTKSASSAGTTKKRKTGKRKSSGSVASKFVKGSAAAKKAMSALRAMRGKSKAA